ncbi:MAG: hypothetical protein ABR969_10715 [Sedimentisphaerales bacterium]|jgi:hypothetical protein
MEYFSEKEKGPIARTQQTISSNVWGGIVALIQSMISSGAFGEDFPDTCPDGQGPIGTDANAFSLVLKSEIPNITWPLPNDPYEPDTLMALDLIQFCYRAASKPIQGSYHSFFRHYHLRFDREAGRIEFIEKINRIFSRNGLAYQLNEDGNIVRLSPPVLDEHLCSAVFRTGDTTLDEMLEESRKKFLNPDIVVRREALERLWDSWERIKTLDDPANKKQSVLSLIKRASADDNFRSMLNNEAKSLTGIGNTFHIRHTEVSQIRLKDSKHIDYLFHRLFALIQLLLNSLNNLNK